MKNIIRQLLVFFVFVVSLNLAAQTLPVITGQVKCQGRGVANVVVTNGFDCVSTDVAGKYTIPYHRDARFVYVTTPAGYLPQRDGSLPLFYQRITKGTSVYDFSLVKNSKNDDKHLFLVQADVQLGKDEDVTAYSEYLRDVKEFVDKCSKYDLFMLDCGDIVGNALSLFSSYKKASDVLDVPMYRVIGNHDMEYGVRSYEHSMKRISALFIIPLTVERLIISCLITVTISIGITATSVILMSVLCNGLRRIWPLCRRTIWCLFPCISLPVLLRSWNLMRYFLMRPVMLQACMTS